MIVEKILPIFHLPSFQIKFSHFLFFPSSKNYLPEACISKTWPSVSRANQIEPLHLKGTEKECKFLQEGLLFPKSRILQYLQAF